MQPIEFDNATAAIANCEKLGKLKDLSIKARTEGKKIDFAGQALAILNSPHLESLRSLSFHGSNDGDRTHRLDMNEMMAERNESMKEQKIRMEEQQKGRQPPPKQQRKSTSPSKELKHALPALRTLAMWNVTLPTPMLKNLITHPNRVNLTHLQLVQNYLDVPAAIELFKQNINEDNHTLKNVEVLDLAGNRGMTVDLIRDLVLSPSLSNLAALRIQRPSADGGTRPMFLRVRDIGWDGDITMHPIHN